MRRTRSTSPTFEPTPLRGDCAVVLGALRGFKPGSDMPSLRLQRRTKDHGTQHAPSSSTLTTSADRRTVFGKMVSSWIDSLACRPARRLPRPHRFGRRSAAVKAHRTPSRLDRGASPAAHAQLCGSRRARPQPPPRRRPCGHKPPGDCTPGVSSCGRII